MSSLLLRNGTIIDPSQGLEAVRDLLIRDGRVVAIDERINEKGAEVFDASDLIVSPGFIDLHVHLREPGFEYKETIASGARAAVAGGFTSICCMPNTKPVNDNSSVTSFIIEQGRAAKLANVFPIGAITQGSKGEQLAEIGEMKAAGIVAISDDGKPVLDSGIMRRAMEYSRDFDLPVVDHCEDCCGAAGWAMHEGDYSALMGLNGLPGAAEDLHVARDITLAELTGARVHIAHISTARSVDLVRQAKLKALAVTCEVTPHHFTLTDKDVYESGYDTDFKMAPPLRSQSDLEAIIEGLRDGTIDAIATDHAPHHANEKMLEFEHAPNGIIGLETAVSLTLDRLVHRGVISIGRMVELLSTIPARIFKLDRGTLKVGAVADVSIFDPNKEIKVDASKFQSKSRNTPFDEWGLKGAAVAAIVGGRVVWRCEEI
ncbi:MAG TPA: dihydroorotase [Blastocatellia bacterium]|nr:dihydroorotase [Blastocatellia bacterium]